MPPAVLAGDTIVLRREAMARWLWEKFEVFGLKRADGPFKAVAQAYDLERDFLAGLPRMFDEQAGDADPARDRRAPRRPPSAPGRDAAGAGRSPH